MEANEIDILVEALIEILCSIKKCADKEKKAKALKLFVEIAEIVTQSLPS